MSGDQRLSRRAVLGTLSAGLIVPFQGRPGPTVPPADEQDLDPGVEPDEPVDPSVPPPAHGLALPAMPVIHRRAEWGARAPKKPAEVLSRGPDHIVIHHTDSPNSADPSLAHAFRLSRDIQWFHMTRRGWDDIGQQLTISRGGHVMEGRNRSLTSILGRDLAVGAQTRHQNDHTIGIENEGTYMTAPVAPSLWNSLVPVCGWLCTVYGLDPFRSIVGHRDYVNTDCPGDVFYRRLPELRRAVAGYLSRRDRR